MDESRAESPKTGDDRALPADSRRPLPDVIADELSRRYLPTELLEMLLALETTAASMAATRAEPDELDEIAKLGAKHQEASHIDQHELRRTDEAFHGAIVRASHNGLFEQSHLALEPQLRDFRQQRHMNHEAHGKSVAEHDWIVYFLRRGDQGGARAAMTMHLLGLYNDVVPGEDATFDGFHGDDDTGPE